MRDLTVLIDDNGVFNNITEDARDYLRDSTAIAYVTAEDFIYLGLYKPFNAVYVELQNSTSAGSMVVELSNGSGFSALGVRDDTKAFSRSGFIKWEREQDSWASQAVNGLDLYWIRLSFDADFTADLDGLNLVFADELSWLRER